MAFCGAQWGVADVELEEMTEERGMTLEESDGFVAEAGMAIHDEERAGHDCGETLDATMGLLVCGEVFGVECGGEG